MALRYWVGGTGNWDSTTTANWSATSGGAGGASVPTAADDVFIDANSGAVTVTKTTSTSCLTLNFTGFTGTWSIANGVTLSVSINSGTAITLGSGMTYTSSTTGVLSHIAANNTTINFNGITIPRLTLGGNGGGTRNVTISGTTPIVNILTVSNTSGNVSLQGTTLNLTTSLTVTAGQLTGNSPNINAGGTFLISTTGTGACAGFTVFSGTALSLQSNLSINGGTIIFNSGSSLTHNNQTLSIVNGPVSYNAISTIEWWNVTHSSTFGNITHLSDLNIANNFTITGGVYGATVTGGPWNINIKGSFIMTTSGTFTFSTLTINLIGTGTIEAVNGSNISSATAININTSNPLGYTIGTASRNFLGLATVTFNLVGTSVATVNSGHTLTVATVTLSTNNTGTGGNQIIWQNLVFALTSGNLTLNSDTTFLGNLSTTSAAIQVNGSKLLIGGNLTLPNSSVLSGTGTIEFTGSGNQNWNTAGFTCTYQNNVTVNKSGGTLTILGTINWGLANRTLQKTAGNIDPGTSTISIGANISVTMSGMTFWNLTIPGASTTTQNTLNTINNNLTLGSSGNTAFTGSAGWTCANLICSNAGRTITLGNSSTGASYRTTTNASLPAGTAASRITMTSDNATTQSIWTLDYGAQQQLIYVNGTRIDSSQGQTVYSFGGTLTSTTNWATGSRPGTIGYTFVN